MKIIPRRIFQLTTTLTWRGASADVVVLTNSAHDISYHSIAYYQQQKHQQKLQPPQQRTLNSRSSLVVVGSQEHQQICLPSSLIIARCSTRTSILNNYCLKKPSQVESKRFLITGHTLKFSCSSPLSRYCNSTDFNSRIRCLSVVSSLRNSYTRNSAVNKRFVYFGQYPRNFYTSTVDNMGWPSDFDEDCKVFFPFGLCSAISSIVCACVLVCSVLHNIFFNPFCTSCSSFQQSMWFCHRSSFHHYLDVG